VMTRRILQGKSPASPDKTHLHHRLLALGISHSGVVILIYIFAFAFGLLGLGLHKQPEWIQMVSGLVACVVLYASLSLCEFFNYNVSHYSWFHKNNNEQAGYLAAIVGRSLKGLRFFILLGLLLPIAFVESAPIETHNLLLGVFVLLLVAYPWKEHTERLNIVYGLFYLTGLTILYVWNVSAFQDFSLSWYTLFLVTILLVWSVLKIRFKGHREVFLTSGLEVLLIFVSWFVPYALLPVLHVSEAVLAAAKTSCLEAIPLFIAMKIVIRRHPDRNYLMVAGLLIILLLMLIVL